MLQDTEDKPGFSLQAHRRSKGDAGSLASLFSNCFGNDARQGGFKSVTPDVSPYKGITAEDRQLWGDYLNNRNAEAIQAILAAKKIHLLTHVIGEPDNPLAGLMTLNESGFGNIMLHDRIANFHDGSVLKSKKTEAQKEARKEGAHRPGIDFLLAYYELLKKACDGKHEKGTDSYVTRKNRVDQAICARDVMGKTPLLLACMMANQTYALRLLALDMDKKTIDIPHTLTGFTPLHVACLFGLDEVYDKLVDMGANTEQKDKRLEKTPSEIFSMDESEVKALTLEILNALNFFHGHYFSLDDSESVVDTLYSNHCKLSTKHTHSQQPVGRLSC